jgi:hypothetical protein
MLLPFSSFSPFPTTAKERGKIDGEDKNDIKNNNMHFSLHFKNPLMISGN